MFERLFTLTPGQFAHGTLTLNGSWAAYLAVVVLLALLVWGTARLAPALRQRDRWLLIALRTGLLALLVLLLFDPTLIAETEEPVSGEVAVLLDDSLSLRIADQGGRARGEFVTAQFAPGSGALARQLDARFQTRYWRFAGASEPLVPGEPLRYNGSRSDLGQALDRLARERSHSLGAIVLVTDGGLDDPAALEPALQRLRAAGIRVHTVGVGSERFATDLELDAVRLPDVIVRGDSVDAEMVIRQRGLDGQNVTLTVEEDSAIVATPTITLPAGQERVTVRVPLTFTRAGPQRLTVQVSSEATEALSDNNSRQQLVQVRDQPLRVLHVEGEPRFEVKFLRRAVADDDAIRLVSLVRTAENKFYRLGIETTAELAAGFPATDEELFRFDLLIIGSADATLLTAEHQVRIRDFVARRGGSVLFLGGTHAFAEGGYADSVLAELLPVQLDAPAPDYLATVQVRPTTAGVRHAVPLPAVQWEQLPALTVVNPLRRTKPGALVLLEADDGAADPLVIFAYQRYGRGTVAVFPVRNSWRWQMHPELGPDDATHETLWRTLLRGLARSAPARVQVQVTPRDAALGQAVTVTAELVDAAYRPLDNAQPTLTLTTPLGDVTTLALSATPEGAGRYTAQFVAAERGHYDLAVAQDASADTLTAQAVVAVDSAGQEFYRAERDTALLARIADQTGGRMFSPDDADELPTALDATRATRVQVQRFALWDAPIFLLALLALAGTEWFYRRRCALA